MEWTGSCLTAVCVLYCSAGLLFDALCIYGRSSNHHVQWPRINQSIHESTTKHHFPIRSQSHVYRGMFLIVFTTARSCHRCSWSARCGRDSSRGSEPAPCCSNKDTKAVLITNSRMKTGGIKVKNKEDRREKKRKRMVVITAQCRKESVQPAWFPQGCLPVVSTTLGVIPNDATYDAPQSSGGTRSPGRVSSGNG